jgi:hypothetical protein
VEPGTSAGGPRFTIDVEVQEETARPLRHYSSMSFAAVRPDAVAIEAMVEATRAEEKSPESVPVPRPEDEDVADTLDNLLSALIRPAAASEPPRAKRKHLSGMLSRIHFPTLCSLFEMERLSGELTVQRDVERVVLYVQDGRIVDMSPVRADASVRDEIGRLLAWEEGTFDFSVQAVTRPDRIGVSTTALILDLARASDEAIEAAIRISDAPPPPSR